MKKVLFIITIMAAMATACGPKATETAPVAVDHSAYQCANQEGLQQICDFIKSCNYYFLATVDGDQARVRPFGTSEVIEGKLYIQTGHIKNVSKQIGLNPNVEICAYNGEQWVRLTGKLVEDERVEIKKAMLDANPSLRSMYNENDDNIAVYYFTEASATINSFTTDPVTVDLK